MTTKQYLMEVHRIRHRIDSLRLREEELRTQAEGLRAILYDKEKVQHSVENRFDDMMADIVTVQEEYANQIDRLHKEILRREMQIAEIDQPRHEEVLRYRYIEIDGSGKQLTLASIARKMGMDYGSIRNLHRNALEAFEKRNRSTIQQYRK